MKGNINIALHHRLRKCKIAVQRTFRNETFVNVLGEARSRGTPSNLERRLSAIMATDVVGYSRLMGGDEVGTLTALKQHRAEMIDPCIAKFQGRIVKLTGDGMLVEFPSVVSAVECACAVQRDMRGRNADVAEDRRIEFRIGVNLGDVIVDDDDIFGDGVNVAARLEGVAKPGGLAVSSAVRDNIGNKLDLIRGYGRPEPQEYRISGARL